MWVRTVWELAESFDLSVTGLFSGKLAALLVEVVGCRGR